MLSVIILTHNKTSGNSGVESFSKVEFGRLNQHVKHMATAVHD